MPNMNPAKTPVREQEPHIRNKNFEEVCHGYDEKEAINEAKRCLNCANKPCVGGCPVNVQIPDFIRAIREGDFESAYRIITETNNLPAICGRVCPQETQCEEKCVRGIKGESVGIGRLERFVADWAINNIKEKDYVIKKNGKKVAVVGSGPAGMTCAFDLAKMGYSVTIFEAFHTSGGVLMYGIPQFRLPKEVVKSEIQNIKKLGVEINCNVVIGKTLTIEELLKEYSAVFIGTGAGLPSFMNIPGEELNGVYSANEFLTRVNLMGAYQFPKNDTPIKCGKKVLVIGGGNVAMDSARCAKRLSAEEVTVIYRRSFEEMPARGEEINHAREEGINFELLTAPVRIIGENGWVTGVECIKMHLAEPDASGRRSPLPIDSSNYVLECDIVIIAIGQSPNPLISDTEDLKTDKRGCIISDADGRTSIQGVFAGGDIVSGSATVILAMGAGKRAGHAIDQYIKSKGE